MFLKCKCGRLLDLDKEFENNCLTRQEGKKFILQSSTAGWTRIDCKCKRTYSFDYALIEKKDFYRSKIKKGPMKGKTIEIAMHK